MQNTMTDSDSPLPLAVVYKGWDEFQRDLLDAVAPLTPEQWALPVAPTHWSIERLVQHIARDRAWWFHLWMGEGDAEVAAIAHWEDEGQPLRSAAELIAGLETTWRLIERCLTQWSGADLGRVFASPAELTEAERKIFGSRTRQWIVWHALRHDIHHGGELAVGMGGYDLPTIWRF